MIVDFFTESIERTPTARLWRQLRISRINFSTHPLYRRWSIQAHQGRLAYWAEELPEHASHYLPLFFITAPFVASLIAITLGIGTVRVVLTVMSAFLLLSVLLIASLAPMMTSAIAALSIVSEREAGRWELLMMIPQDREAVLMMRIATMLFPYRPLISMLDLLQTISAILLAIILNAPAASSNAGASLLSACLLFIVPSLFLLSWERRQDYAFSVALGGFGGLAKQEDKALAWALGGSVMMLAARGIIGMIAVIFAPTAGGLGTILPAFVAGPAVLPILGIPVGVFVAILVAYYIAREWIIISLWKQSVKRVEDDSR